MNRNAQLLALLLILAVALLGARPANGGNGGNGGNGDNDFTNNAPLALFAFNENQGDYFLGNKNDRDFSRFVHPGDTINLIIGNWDRRLDTDLVTRMAEQFRDQTTGLHIICSTMGENDIRRGIDDLDPDLIDTIMWVWEPDTQTEDNTDWPGRGFPGDMDELTRELFEEWGPRVRNAGFDFGAKPTGRIVPPRGNAGEIELETLVELCDEINFQMQDHCQSGLSTWREGLDSLVQVYEDQGVDGQKGLYTQITIDDDATNGTDENQAMRCAQYAWSLRPVVTAPSIWWATNSQQIGRMERFLEMREERL